MILKAYLSEIIKPVILEEISSNKYENFEDLKYNHIPLINPNNELIGMISKQNLIETSFKNFDHLIENFFLLENSSIIDGIKIFNNSKTNVIPVINEYNLYLGSILLDDVVIRISNFSYFSEPGEVIELICNNKEHSISQVAQIVESNNMKILGVLTQEKTDDLFTISVKIQGFNVFKTIETFKRYNYTIKNRFINEVDEKYIDERYKQFMKFINM